jgi:homoserine O-succinyltransferase
MSVLVHPPQRHRPRDGEADPIVVGLVNNMPDAALRTTERQFLELLSAASGGHAVRLRLLSVPQVPRGETGRVHVGLHYESIGQVWDDHFDGLIVTGTEPRAPLLQDEPYWPALAALTDWAEDHTASTIWSCLAAQVAVLRASGIVRRPFGWKLSGVFPCTKVAEHAITAGFPPRWCAPQTRYNDLPEQALTASGYRILSRLPDAGTDIFVREGRSLFLFVQGHPEYDPEALFREYRRDIGRFLSGERDTYPDPLQGYFAEDTAAALEAFRWRALRTRDPALLLSLPDAVAGWTPLHGWREPAIRLYANWLSFLAQRKCRTTGLAETRSGVAASL